MIVMRKPRVELKCGMFAMIIGLSLVISVLILSSSGEYVPESNEYSSYEISLNPPTADYIYPLANYSLVRSGVTISLFDRIGLEFYEPGIEFVGDTKLNHADQYGQLDIHKVPSTFLQYSAFGPNSMKFELNGDTGAIKKGSAVVVGSEDASGVFVMSGGATASIGEQEVIFTMPANSTVIFRADTPDDLTIGSAVAEDQVAAEMYLFDGGYVIGEDVISFQDVNMYTVAASEETVKVQVAGESTGRAVVIHVSEEYLTYGTADEIHVLLDGEKVSMGDGMAETLWSEGEEPSYFAAKTGTGYDVVVYLPENTDSVISITGPEAELGVDGLVTLLAAIGIVGVAVVALLKTE